MSRARSEVGKGWGPTDRMLKRLVEQVDGYAALIDEHGELFAELYGTLLGHEVKFDALTEKWVVWPGTRDDVDPREAELRERGIRVVGYTEDEGGGFGFRVGGKSG